MGSMIYRTIPGTALRASRFGYGTGTLHHVFSKASRLRLMETAWDLGINYFDTAPLYGHRVGERSLGEFLGSRRTEAIVATKVGILAGAWSSLGQLPMYAAKVASVLGRRAGISVEPRRIDFRSKDAVRIAEASLNGSLRALRTEYVDILFIHEPPLGFGLSDEALRWLESLRTRGIARYLGIAGEPKNVGLLAGEYPGIADLLQVRDSIRLREADVICSMGRELQITYGYFRSGLSTYEQACERNPRGVVLFGTTNQDRIKSLPLGE